LMVGQEFTTPDGESTINYIVGQPMGAKSSWPMFTLSHHIIVQYAALSVGYNCWFNNYIMLGDDIVINDNNVAKAYIEILTE
jgi:hypothetical protein